MARSSLANALLARAGPDDAPLAAAHAHAAREAFRRDPSQFEDPAFILRVHLDALEANGLEGEALRAREEARAWVHERAGQLRSERYRRSFLESQPDVVRILATGVA